MPSALPNGPQDPLVWEVAEVVLQPDLWLDTPNERLGGLAPRSMLGFPEGRRLLYDLVQNVKHGMTT
jgi:uncharacterized protein (DUF2384 family)